MTFAGLIPPVFILDVRQKIRIFSSVIEVTSVFLHQEWECKITSLVGGASSYLSDSIWRASLLWRIGVWKLFSYKSYGYGCALNMALVIGGSVKRSRFWSYVAVHKTCPLKISELCWLCVASTAGQIYAGFFLNRLRIILKHRLLFRNRITGFH